MNLTVTSPNISNINTLFDIYKNQPDRNQSILNLSDFYAFLQKSSLERKIFLDQYCHYEFMSVATSLVLRLYPKQ